MDTTKTSPFRACARCGVVYRSGFQRCPIDGEELTTMTQDVMVGKTLGRYVVEAFLGAGMTGRVYRARHGDLTRRYAVKVLYGDFSANPDMSARFRREAEAASRLDHPNVVRVFDARVDPGEPSYLVMDLVEGPTLNDWLKSEGPWPEADTIELMGKLASGLAHAHAHGIIHRDLKPDNILFGPEPRITDFGVAWVTPSPDSPQLTRAGEVLGTPGFIAPEVIMGHPATQRADLYALGMVGFQTLIGRHPYSGSELEVMTKTLNKGVPVLAEYGVEAPRLEPLLHRLIPTEPSGRPASATEATAQLETLAHATETARPWLDPFRLTLGIGAAIIVLGGAALGLRSEEAQPPAASDPPVELPVLEPGSKPTTEQGTKPETEPEAEPTSLEAELEAAPLVEPEAKPAPRRPRRTRPSRTKPTEGSGPGEKAAAPVPSQPPATSGEFRALYGRVAKRLEALASPDSAHLRERFMGISITQAMQDETSRARAMKVLRSIERDARRLDAEAEERPSTPRAAPDD